VSELSADLNLHSRERYLSSTLQQTFSTIPNGLLHCVNWHYYKMIAFFTLTLSARLYWVYLLL